MTGERPADPDGPLPADPARGDPLHRWDGRVALGLAGASVAVRAVPAWAFYGTSDVWAWEQLAVLLLGGENFYASGWHNWPPLWIYFAAGAWLVHLATDLPFAAVVKLPPILADACIAVLVYRAGVRLGWDGRRAARAGLAYALSPISILVSGYHGQFDALMLAPTVLAWYCWEFGRGRRGMLASGLALGLGVWAKTVPALFLPVYLPRLPTWSRRLAFLALALGPAGAATLPYFLLWPAEVAWYTFNYQSWFGQWGYPVAWQVVSFARTGDVPSPVPSSEPGSPAWLMYRASRWLLLGALAWSCWYTWRRRLDMMPSLLTVTVVFYVAAGGFGLHYLVWAVPFALIARDRWLYPYTVAATVALLAAYALRSDIYGSIPPIAWPQETADAREFVARAATLPAWLVCGLWAHALIRQARGPRDGSPAARSVSGPTVTRRSSPLAASASGRSGASRATVKPFSAFW